MEEAEKLLFDAEVAQRYDTFMGPFVFEPFAVDMAQRVLKSGAENILEIACGTGRVTRHLAAGLPAQGRITATDISEPMLQVGRNALPDARISWLVARAEALPFADDSFDAVVCQFGLMFFEDRKTALHEMWRVLKPGGILCFNTWNRRDYCKAIDISRNTIATFFPGGEPENSNLPFSMYDPEAFQEWMQQAGFENTEIQLLEKTGVSPTARDAATGMVTANHLYHFIRKQGKEMELRILDAVTAELSLKLGDAPLQSPLSAWVVSGYKPN
ncbi:MAG: methyltransferase domain-containing protein [Bacteroidetes bacterium]|nr:methyltransferase domain-containing protein [Bacteroidota bacterium]